MKLLKLLLTLAITSTLGVAHASNDEVVLDFLNNRFGMFIHYNMGTFHAEQWAKPNHDPKSFNPTQLDCGQWADAAKAAQMSYAVFTTKHHDGFCLWDTAVTDYDVASSSYEGDIVKEYVDAFRSRGLKVGLYFSVWDRQHNISKGSITPKGIEYTKRQLTELLTSYGEIICIVIDGWGSIWGESPTFEELPYNILADHIHSIQPNCLVINHSCRAELDYGQIVHYEATHGQHCPYDNTIPSQQGPTIQPTWFWERGYENLELKPLDEILSEIDFCNSHYANYLLNAAPNASGLMDKNVVDRLAQVGAAWKKPRAIKRLPKAQKPHQNVGAMATSIEQDMVPSATLDADLYSYWQAAEGDAQPTITLDFGRAERFNKILCGEAHKCKDVEAFVVEAEVDGAWREIAVGEAMGYHWESMFHEVEAQRYRIRFTEFKRAPRIAEITFVNYREVE